MDIGKIKVVFGQCILKYANFVVKVGGLSVALEVK